jgi:cytochrome c oxidase subunit 4
MTQEPFSRRAAAVFGAATRPHRPVSYVDLGLWNTVVALLIASVKASLVALFFMHLKGESRLVWGFALFPIVFLVLILLGTLSDTMLR